MFLDSCSIHLLPSASFHCSDEEFDRLSQSASYVCPNCDGELSNYESELLGICGDCYGDSAKTFMESPTFNFATGH